MANAYVQVAPDQAGKKVQTFENTVGGQLVEAQAAVLVDSTGAEIVPAKDATLTGGTAKAIARGGAKGATAAADVTSTASGANHQGADVCLYDASGNLIDPRSIRALTAADVVTATIGTDSVGLAKDASLLLLALLQGSTTSGQKGPLLQAAVTNAPPSYTDGQTSPLSMNLVGDLRTRTDVAKVAGANTLAGNGPTGTGSLRVTVASDNTAFGVNATGPTLTKGTQGATGFSTQDLKDSGRVTIMWTAEVAGAATTEGLLTVTESRDGAATTTFTSKVVTNGKRLRITSLQIAIETLGTGTAPQRVYLRLRFNTAGAVTTGSALQGTWMGVNNAAIVKSGAPFECTFPDGIEFAGDGTKQIGLSIQFPDWVTTTATVQAKITMTGFEY